MKDKASSMLETINTMLVDLQRELPAIASSGIIVPNISKALEGLKRGDAELATFLTAAAMADLVVVLVDLKNQKDRISERLEVQSRMILSLGKL